MHAAYLGNRQRTRHASFLPGVIPGLLLAALCATAILGCSDSTRPSETTLNHAPRLLAQRDTIATVGDTLRLRAMATDVDQDALTFGVITILTQYDWLTGWLPDAAIDMDTGEFRFIPDSLDAPRRFFIFKVRDPHGAQDSTEFSIEVRE